LIIIINNYKGCTWIN